MSRFGHRFVNLHQRYDELLDLKLVLFVIRTMGIPPRAGPSVPLAITTILIVIIGVLRPYSPLAGILGFTKLPGALLYVLTIWTITCLLLVELVKRFFFSRSEF